MAARDPALGREIAARAGRANIAKHGVERIRSLASFGGRAFVAKYGTDPRDSPWYVPRGRYKARNRLSDDAKRAIALARRQAAEWSR
jgi:hypothetical protein